MKKKNLKSLRLNKKVISEFKGGKLPEVQLKEQGNALSWYFWCTIEFDCPSIAGSCDLYCTIA